MLAGSRQGLSELGWIEGRNLAFQLRFADGNVDRLPQLADELVRANVDVIVTGSSPAASAAKNATSTIPIVMVTTGDWTRQ
jgi:putative tryptophan/tyrosine transport system substrate-binding protein